MLYLKELNYKLLKYIIINFIFKNLFNSFNTITSCKYKKITKDIINIDISKLIFKETKIFNNINLKTNKIIIFSKNFYKYYNKKEYIELKSFIEYFKLKTNYKPKYKKINFKNKFKNKKTESNKIIMNTFLIIKRNFNYKLILNSSTIKHYTLIKKQLIDYKIIKNKTIIIVNKNKISILIIINLLY